MTKRKSSKSHGPSSKRSATSRSSTVGRKWITDFGLANLNRADFWREHKGGGWTVEDFAKHVVSNNGPTNLEDIRRALLKDINCLTPHVKAETHKNHAVRIGASLKARNGSAYRELESFCESGDFLMLVSMIKKAKRAADCAQVAAMSLAHQKGAQALVQEALGPEVLFSETDSSMDESVAEPESVRRVKEWMVHIDVASTTNDAIPVAPDSGSEDANVESPQSVGQIVLENIDAKADTLYEDPSLMFMPKTKTKAVNTADPASYMDWTLKSGKNVLQTIKTARNNLNPKHREISLIWWGIIDVSGTDKGIAGKYLHRRRIRGDACGFLSGS
ncbi:hypothetical protein BC832DRAFT_130578 [Gaertneriomyces semiglobifer]|nr:hypothetical protein BC832DRAFT_130578 [Gaertneriomyces semiglobifer]